MKPNLSFAFAALIPAIAMSAPQHSPHAGKGSETINPGWVRLQESMQTMHAAMVSVEPSQNGDVDFVRLMLPHHQAAIDMAKVQLIYGTDRQMRRLAQEIITDQQAEIELMRLWLKQQTALPDKPEHAALAH